MGESWYKGEITTCLVTIAENNAAMDCIPPFYALLQLEKQMVSSCLVCKLLVLD